MLLLVPLEGWDPAQPGYPALWVPSLSPAQGHGLISGSISQRAGQREAPSPPGRGRAGGSGCPRWHSLVAPMAKHEWVWGSLAGTFPETGTMNRGVQRWGFPAHPCHEFWPQLCP